MDLEELTDNKSIANQIDIEALTNTHGQARGFPRHEFYDNNRNISRDSYAKSGIRSMSGIATMVIR